MRAIKLTQFLSTGKAGAKTAKELQQILGYKNVRDVTKEIHRLRCAGEVIISNNTGENMGYFLPENEEDIRNYIRCTFSRIKQMKRAVKPATQLLNTFCGDDE